MDPKPLQPFEAYCDHCHQQRPLFLYEPDHNCHLVPVVCRWCDRDKQPLLCTRCWDIEKQLEDRTPADPQELAIGGFLSAVVSRSEEYYAQAADDRATCEGIAAATEESAS
ncbi:hypothetical protein ACFXJO_05795 [Streptomyces lavendulae]|uniref:hypothetical protein n=1 Tax=Streptomyces lavendulae TaxID=1914 RepID=UPI00367684B3